MLWGGAPSREEVSLPGDRRSLRKCQMVKRKLQETHGLRKKDLGSLRECWRTFQESQEESTLAYSVDVIMGGQ